MDGYRFMFYHSLYIDNNFVSSMTTCNLIHCIRSPGINGRDQVDRTQETKGRGSSRREYILTEKGRSVMTQTVKKRAAILLLFAIAVASLFYLSTLPGEFLITSRSSMDEESHDFSETILLGTGISWTGLWKPTILEVDFLGEDNYFKGQEELSFDLFIDEERHVGSVLEGDLILSYPLHDVKDFKMKEKDMNLVFRVDQKEDQMYLNNVRSIRIHYSVFGSRRSRIIDFMEEV